MVQSRQVEALDVAARDPRVLGLVLVLPSQGAGGGRGGAGGGGLDLVVVQELRESIERMRTSGKP